MHYSSQWSLLLGAGKKEWWEKIAQQKCYATGDHFTNYLSFAFQIWQKFNYYFTWIVRHHKNFAHAMAAMLSWHVEKFIVISWLAIEFKSNSIWESGKHLRWKMICEMIPWRIPHGRKLQSSLPSASSFVFISISSHLIPQYSAVPL